MNPLTLPLQYLRLAGVILGAVVLAWMVYLVQHWRADSLRLSEVEARSAEIIQQASDAMETLAEQHRAALKASQGYQDELSKLRAARDSSGPAPKLRVCKPSVSSGSPQSGAAPGPDGSSSSSGGGEEATEFDTQPLYALADQCDEVSARLRGLQQWVTEAR